MGEWYFNGGEHVMVCKVYCCEKFQRFYVEVGEEDSVVLGNPEMGFLKLDMKCVGFKRFLHKASAYLGWVKVCPWCGKKLKNFYSEQK